jgi:hypothetical protein
MSHPSQSDMGAFVWWRGILMTRPTYQFLSAAPLEVREELLERAAAEAKAFERRDDGP